MGEGRALVGRKGSEDNSGQVSHKVQYLGMTLPSGRVKSCKSCPFTGKSCVWGVIMESCRTIIGSALSNTLCKVFLA